MRITHTRVKGAGPAWCQILQQQKMCKALSSHQIESVFARIREQHTRQNKPYRLGVVPAGVVGARGRCCPASTVPVAVVFACGVCCCIAVEIQNKSSTEKQSSAIIVHKAKRTATSTRTKNVCSERLRAAGGRDIVSYTHVICSALL